MGNNSTNKNNSILQEEKKYVIIETSEIDSVDFSKTNHTSAQYLRLNNAGTKCVIGYRGDQPAFFTGKQEYTEQEIHALTNSDTNEWYIPPNDLQDGSWRDRATSVVKRYNPFKKWFS